MVGGGRGATRSKYGRARRDGGGMMTIVWGGLSLLLLVGLVVGGWAVIRVRQADAIDVTTLCPTDGAVGALAFLFDLTDPLSSTQASQLRTLVEKEVAASPRGSLVAVGVVDDMPEAWGARLAICKPMTGREAGGLVRNPAQVEARYRSAFIAPLESQIDAMLASEPASSSPIMEALQALMAGSAAIPLVEGAPHRLIVVSDLLQHSEAMSFYRGENWGTFVAGSAYSRLARSLEGVQVELLIAPRPNAEIDREAVDDFWVRYFEAQGADRVLPRALGDL